MESAASDGLLDSERVTPLYIADIQAVLIDATAPIKHINCATLDMAEVIWLRIGSQAVNSFVTGLKHLRKC